MCTEFFLALLYFLVIFTINFFLYKVLSFYVKNIIQLQKIKIINKRYPNNKLILKLYEYSNTEFRNLNNLNTLEENKDKTIDTLIIGNIYKYLKTSVKNNQKKNSLSEYYFQLLENQYLSFNFNVE
jgi:hypothetical protein